MAQEIERKFLVRGDFKSDAVRSVRMAQGYLCPGSGKTVRVRIAGDKAYLTIKGPSYDGGLSRFEWEKEITIEDARSLLTLAEDSIIDKTRYYVPSEDGRHTWEVDEFYGDNEGLVVAEVELLSAVDAVPKPSWLGEEVTGDRRFYNAQLTRNPYKNWK